MLIPKTIGNQLLAGAVIFMTALIIGLSAITVCHVSSSFEESAREYITTTAKNTADILQLALHSELTTGQTMASDSMVTTIASQADNSNDYISSTILSLLSSNLKSKKEMIGDKCDAILVTNASGVVIADSADGRYLGQAVNDQLYFVQAWHEGQAIGRPVKSTESGNLITPFCALIKSEQEKPIGALIYVLKVKYLTAIIQSQKIGKTGYPFLADDTGVIFAHPDQQLIMNLNIADVQGMENMTQRLGSGETGAGFYFYQGVQKIAGFASVELPQWRLFVSQHLDEINETPLAIRNLILFFGFLAVAFNLLFLAVFIKRINRKVYRIANQLVRNSEQVFDSSTRVSSISFQLAESVGKQSAAIEKASVFLQETTHKTNNSAELAAKVGEIMKKAGVHVQHLSDQMNQLVSMMAEAHQCHDEIGEIVNLIKHIAFQTNLLSLNAAIEAAHAGDVGSGFAVVAGEVRNLSAQTTQSAKTIQELIEKTLSVISHSRQLYDETQRAVRINGELAGKVAQMISDIVLSAQDHVKNICQINQSVVDIDQAIQITASQAEKASAAAAIMKEQSEQMIQTVIQLVSIVGKNGYRYDHKRLLSVFPLKPQLLLNNNRTCA